MYLDEDEDEDWVEEEAEHNESGDREPEVKDREAPHARPTQEVDLDDEDVGEEEEAVDEQAN